MLRTRLTQDYGIELPFVSAGMGFLSLPELVAAVSNAGGLGSLGAAPEPPNRLQAMVRKVKALSARPFGADLIVETGALGPFTTEEHIQVCLAEEVKLVVFFWNLPPPTWIERLHQAGAKVWMQVGSVEAARDSVTAGADAVVIQGSEPGATAVPPVRC
jgi:enoyl-[acyl-carrier protein] reductase II